MSLRRLILLTALLTLTPGSPARADDPEAVVVFLVDTSDRPGADRLLQTRDLAAGVMESLTPGSQAAVLAFDTGVRQELQLSSEPGRMTDTIEALRSEGDRALLHDALHAAGLYLRQVPPTRKAIVLVSHGREAGSSRSLDEALAVALEDEIPIFAVGMGRADAPLLRRVAKLTGGLYSPVDEASGFEIASLILDIEPKAAAAAPAPATTPAVEAPGATVPLGGYGRWVLLGVAVVAAAVFAISAGLGLWWFLRQTSSRKPLSVGAEPFAKTALRPQPMALEILEGPGAGITIPVSLETACSLGRVPDNDVLLDDQAVSGQHCRIQPTDQGWVLHDLGSTNGTFVNGNRITRHPLRAGDQIRVGASLIRFRAS